MSVPAPALAGAARPAAGTALALLVLAGGLAVLAGWWLDLAWLKGAVAGGATTKANSALLFVTAGVALWLAATADPGTPLGGRRRIAVRSLACFMAIVAGATLFEILSARDLGIDQLLFADETAAHATSSPGRMAPVSAIDFLLVAVAVWQLDADGRRGRRVGELCLVPVAASALLAFYGYLYGVDALYRIAQLTSMALPTSILLLACCLALLFARPGSLVGEALRGAGPGAMINRRMLPAAFVVPPFFSWLLWQGELAGWYSEVFGLALFTSCNVVFFTALVWWNARSVERLHAQREALARSNDWHQAMQDSALFTMISTDGNGVIRTMNAGASAALGYAPDELVGKATPAVIHDPLEVVARARDLSAELDEVVPPGFEVFVARARRGLHEERDWTYVRKDGSRLPVRLSVTALADDAGRITGFLGIGKDITELRAAERALREEQERATVMLESIGDAVVAFDASSAIIFLNPVAERLTGWTRSRALGRPLQEVVRLVDLDTGLAPDAPLIPAPGQIRYTRSANIALLRLDGVQTPIEETTSPILDSMDGLLGGVVVLRDVSESRAMALSISHQAQHDYLTDLPNRLLLEDRLEQALAAGETRRSGAVMFIDLDHFKTINDSLGHHAGDIVLREVARRLSATVRADDTVSRQGGDEFVVLLPRLGDPRDAARVAGKLLDAMRPPIVAEGNSLHIDLSIGIALFPEDSEDPAELTKCADTALYHAKQAGRGRYSYFAADMRDAARLRLRLEQDLRATLAGDGLFLQFQPKASWPGGRITGVEALVRWRRDDGRITPPLEFIPVAEECGLIGALDEWVLRAACAQHRAWLDLGIVRVPIAVNVSLARLDSVRLLALVGEVLEATGLPPDCLEIEFTESQMFADHARASVLIEGLRAIGVRIAIDDFGTGYSNLSYLVQHRFDTLKIDRSFVADLPGDAKQLAVVQAVIAMARALDAAVVAEGVENREQAEALALQGCSEQQGYLYSRPLDPGQLLPALLRGRLLAATGAARVRTLARRQSRTTAAGQLPSRD